VQGAGVAAREDRRLALERVRKVSKPGATGRAVPPPAGSETRYSPIRDGAMRGVTSLTTGASPKDGKRLG